MCHFDDIGLGIAHDPRHFGEGARHVTQVNFEPQKASIAVQHAHDDGGQQPRIDVATTQHNANLFVCEHLGMGEHGSERCGAGTLGNGLFNLEVVDNGTLNCRLTDRHNVVNQFADDLGRQAAHFFDRDSFRHGEAATCRRQTGQCVDHGRIQVSLNADDFDPGLDGFGGDRHPGYQATTTNRNCEAVQVRDVGKHFQCHRALAGDHLRIVIGMDGGQAFLFCEAVGDKLGSLKVGPFEDDPCA